MRVIDATAIDEPDGSYDTVFFANAFHHLAPAAATPAVAHDAFISFLRAYSPSAFTALGKAADPEMEIEVLRSTWTALASVAVAFRRHTR